MNSSGISSPSCKHLIGAFLCPLSLPAFTYGNAAGIDKIKSGTWPPSIGRGRLLHGHQHKIRLAAIDAPERKQPFGAKSKQNLSDMVYRQQVTVEWTKRDRNGRIL